MEVQGSIGDVSFEDLILFPTSKVPTKTSKHAIFRHSFFTNNWSGVNFESHSEKTACIESEFINIFIYLKR